MRDLDSLGQTSLIRPGSNSLLLGITAGPGDAPTAKYCSICHPTGYIPMQPRFPEAKWAAIVEKMRKVFGAPVPEKAAKEISRYLGSHYSPRG